MFIDYASKGEKIIPTAHKTMKNDWSGFSKLSRKARFERLMAAGVLTAEDVQYLINGGLDDLGLGEKLIENVIGYFQLPLGVATHFCIDDKDCVIPLAVEETSIIAALSKTAKWIKYSGCIQTKTIGDDIIGQIYIPQVQHFNQLSKQIDTHRQSWIDDLNQTVAKTMCERGGGVRDIQLRALSHPDGHESAVIHLTMNCCDAMGANIINQVLEALKHPIEATTGETVGVCILSNLNDEKLTQARIEINQVDSDLGHKIEAASMFAESCPYRAATHNKGIMNGIDPVLIATGNDWRAVEAGMHAYACRDGQYRALSTWRYQPNEQKLIGTLKAPIIVGTVGGVTAVHPTANLCLKMMGITQASHLSRVIAAVGLVQNLGALKALCTEGIIQGHMKLHIDNLMLVAGANDKEIPVLKQRLNHWLTTNRSVSLQQASKFLAEIRGI